VFAVQTMNDSSLWRAHGWKDRHKTLYDVISNNDVTFALTSYVFSGCINFKKFFCLTYRLAKLFEPPSYDFIYIYTSLFIEETIN